MTIQNNDSNIISIDTPDNRFAKVPAVPTKEETKVNEIEKDKT